MAEVLGVIPARGGSKGIPRKNLRLLAGVPLIDYTFAAVRESKRLSRTVLSTDDADIAARGRAAGVEVPFLRPAELARDDTPSLPVIQHAIGVLEASGYRPAVVVVLQPTSPLRRGQHIDDAVDLLLDGRADSVVSVVEVPHGFHPLSALSIDDGRLVPFVSQAPRDLFRRQDKPTVWARNGAAVYAVRRDVVMERDSLFGDDCRPYVMSRADSVDIDDDLDLLVAEAVLRQRGAGAPP